jgi:hypothetical protein
MDERTIMKNVKTKEDRIYSDYLPYKLKVTSNKAKLAVMGWDERTVMKELGITLEEVHRLIGLKEIDYKIKGVPYSIKRQVKEDIKP